MDAVSCGIATTKEVNLPRMGHEDGLWMNWQRRWIVARNSHNLYYRKNEDAKEMKGFWRAVLAKCGSEVALRTH